MNLHPECDNERHTEAIHRVHSEANASSSTRADHSMLTLHNIAEHSTSLVGDVAASSWLLGWPGSSMNGAHVGSRSSSSDAQGHRLTHNSTRLSASAVADGPAVRWQDSSTDPSAAAQPARADQQLQLSSTGTSTAVSANRIQRSKAKQSKANRAKHQRRTTGVEQGSSTVRYRHPPSSSTQQQVQSQIKACRSWQQLMEVAANIDAMMDPLLLSAVICRAAELAPHAVGCSKSEHAQHKDFIAHMLHLACRHVAAVQQQHQQACGGFEQRAMGHDQKDGWSEGYVGHAVQHASFSSQSMYNGINKLGVNGSSSSMSNEGPSSRGSSHSSQSSTSTSETAGSAAAAAAAATTTMSTSSSGLPRHHPAGFEPYQVAGMLASLATFYCRPSNSFLTHVWQFTLPQLPDWDCQSLSKAAWALVTLELQPPKAWSETFLSACSNSFHVFNARQFATVIWATAKLGWRPHSTWMIRWFDRLQQLLPLCNAQDVANIMWALAKLNVGVHRLQHQPTLAVALSSSAGLRDGSHMLSRPLPPSTMPTWSSEATGATTAASTVTASPASPAVPPATLTGSPNAHVIHTSMASTSVRTVMQAPGSSECCEVSALAVAPGAVATTACLSSLTAVATTAAAAGGHGHHDMTCCPACEARTTHNAHHSSCCSCRQLGNTICMHHHSRDGRHISTPACVPGGASATALIGRHAGLGSSMSGQTPLSTWLQPCLLSAIQQHVATFKSQELANVCWAVAKLQLRPSSVLMTSLLHAAQLQLTNLAPQEVANVLWSLAHMKHKPPTSWVTAVLSSVLVKLPACNAHALSNVLWALATLGVQPPAPWMQRVLWHSQVLLTRMGPQAVALTIWALAHMQYRPPVVWTQQFFASFVANWDGFTAQGLSNVAWSLGKLSIKVPDWWLYDFHSACLKQMSHFKPQEVSNLMWALANLSTMPGCRTVQPSRKWWHEFFGSSEQLLSRCSPQALAVIMLSLALMRVRPEQAWCDEYLVQSRRQMKGFTAQGLANMGRGLGMLGIWPGSQWLDEWEFALMLRDACMKSFERKSVVWATSRFQELRTNAYPTSQLTARNGRQPQASCMAQSRKQG